MTLTVIVDTTPLNEVSRINVVSETEISYGVRHHRYSLNTRNYTLNTVPAVVVDTALLHNISRKVEEI
jgi:hypothetical protein